MKIVHLCLGAFFPDNYSYQENMLPKFHKKAGFDVEVIASLDTFDCNGNPSYYNEAKQYINENDVLVTRLDYQKPVSISVYMRRFKGLKQALYRSKPDILFIHNCQFVDICIVVRYLKMHANTVVYVDNHADFSNSATNWISRNILHRVVWKRCAKSIEPFTRKFYGVLPARVDFLKNVYGLPSEKCELLVMGADDDLVELAEKNSKNRSIRRKYNISEEDFLIVTGGKIDQWKKQTLLLMKSIYELDDPNVKLLVFGSVTEDLKSEVEKLTDGKQVIYAGWIDSKMSYDYFAAANLVVFPGRHSVFWEQVVAQGIPMICKKWDGTTHVDVGGNVLFLEHDSSTEITEAIKSVLYDKARYEKMIEVARERGRMIFSYKSIAERAINE